MDNVRKYELSDISLGYQKDLIGDALRAFERFKDKPVSCLEIGVFEGGSAVWFLDNILTHKDSDYLGVDDVIRGRARDNLSKHPEEKWMLVNGDSNKILPLMIKEQYTFDMIYIDGCHQVEYALNDLMNSIRLLNDGGVILIDDYEHPDYGLKEPIDNYLDDSSSICDILFRTYRIGIQRKGNV